MSRLGGVLIIWTIFATFVVNTPCAIKHKNLTKIVTECKYYFICEVGDHDISCRPLTSAALCVAMSSSHSGSVVRGNQCHWL